MNSGIYNGRLFSDEIAATDALGPNRFLADIPLTAFISMVETWCCNGR